MATLDITSVAVTPIYTLANYERWFLMWPDAANSWAAATVTMVIYKGTTPIITHTYNNGVVMTPKNKLKFFVPALPKGDYFYECTVTPKTGEEVQLQGWIHATTKRNG